MRAASDRPAVVRVSLDDPDRPVLHLVGEFDLAIAPKLRAVGSGLIGSHHHVVLDCTELTFIDSTGISALIWLHYEAAAVGSTLLLRGLAAHPAKVLNITGVSKVLNIEPSAGAISPR